jgi:uncharacterized membrane protein
MRIAAAVFAATMVGLGLWGLVGRDFAPIWRPVHGHGAAREALVWICGLVSLAGGLGILWDRTRAPAAGVLAALLIIWMAVFKAPAVVGAPGVAAAWESCGETAVLAAGAWALFAQGGGGRSPPLVAGDSGVRAAQILYALAMMVFGVAHLAYLEATAALVPGWLPGRVAWVWLTAATYLGAGVAMLAGAWARLAAALSALQMGLFTLLVWAPVLARGHAGADDWSEAAISWSLAAAGAVVAASYAGASWFAAGAGPSRRRG